MKDIGFRRWYGMSFHFPTYTNNIYKELDFGVFSVILGKGRHHPHYWKV